MAELLTTDTELQTVANAIRGKTGGTSALGYPNGFATAIAGIGSAGNAAAGDIRSGKKAYVGNSIVTGMMTEKAAETYNTSGSDQTIAAGQYLAGAQTIRKVTTSNIAAANIKAGVTIKVGDAADDDRIAGVIGTFTSDANAAAGHILSGKTAYVNGSKITGNIPSKGAATYNASTSDQTISSGQYLSGAQTIRGVTTENISPENIKKGVTVKVGDTGSATRIKNVTGTCTPVYLSMPESSECFIPFMFKTTDALTLGIYRGSGGFFISAGGASAKQFVVPCNIKMTFYSTDTAASTTSLTFYAGTVYTLSPYNNTVALITGGGYNTTVWKIIRWEPV